MDRPPSCVTCAFLRLLPRGRRHTSVCGKTNENAYAERGNPNGCGPDGKNWSAKSLLGAK